MGFGFWNSWILTRYAYLRFDMWLRLYLRQIADNPELKSLNLPSLKSSGGEIQVRFTKTPSLDGNSRGGRCIRRCPLVLLT